MPDVLILGGGVAGASLAAHLAPHLQVTLLERENQAGYHATGRSAAVFVPSYGDGPIRTLSRLSREFFDTPDPEFFHAPLLSPRGLLRLVREEGTALYEAAMADAVGIEDVTLGEAATYFPILERSRFVSASYERDVHDIDVDAMLQGYLRMARRRGAEIRFGVRVESIERRSGEWTVRTPDGLYRAAVLVDAAGAWADEVAMLAGVEPLELRACRRSVAVLPLTSSLAVEPRLPLTVPFPLRWFAKAEAARLLVSTAEETPVAPHDAFAEELTLAEGLDRFEKDTTYRVERLQGSWAGLRTFTADGYPVIGFEPRAEGFFWFAGQGGSGIQTAPALAELGAKRLLGTDTGGGPGGALDVRRFR